MELEEVKNENMYCLIAPDGTFQAMTLAPDEIICAAVIKMLHKANLGQSYHELKMKGFKIMPVIISVSKSLG